MHGVAPLIRPVGRMAALAFASAACWWLWMAWDRTYQHDPVTGAASGPYQPWQVVGCVLSLVAVAVLAVRRINPVAAAGIMTVSFTSAWSWAAATADDSGLWAVGATMVLLGMLTGSTIVCGVATVMWAGRREPRCGRGLG